MYTELNNNIMFFGLEYAYGSKLFKNHQVIRKYLHYDGEHISLYGEQKKLQGLQRMKKLRMHFCEE
jgi:hypothetical protein